MKFDLTQAKFIPQSNVNKFDASLDHLVEISIKVKEKFDLVFNKEKSNWKIRKDFISLQPDNEGWTAAYQDGFVFLIKTNTSQIDTLQPKFLKGKKGKCNNVFKSDYFSLIMGEAFNLEEVKGFYLEKQEQQEIEVYLVTNIKLEITDSKSDEIIDNSLMLNVDTTKETLSNNYLSEEINSFPVSQVLETKEYFEEIF